MKKIFIIFSLICLSGCFGDFSKENLHRNFLAQFNRVGKDIRSYYRGNAIPDGIILNNGLTEIKEKLIRRDCFVYYEYDPNSFIVKNWRWEGDECIAAI